MGNKFDSVFADCGEENDAFDTIFGGEEDDALMDAVCGFNEAGDPTTLPEEDELHHNEDDANSKDFEKELGPDNDTKNKPTDDSNGKHEIGDETAAALAAGDESEAGEFYNDEDENYQNGKSDGNSNVDVQNLEGESEKSMSEWANDFFNESDEGDEDVPPDMGEDDDDDLLDEVCGNKKKDSDEPYDEWGNFFSESGDGEDEEDALIDAAQSDDTSASLNGELAYNDEDEALVDMVSGEED